MHKIDWPGMVAHNFSQMTWEAEEGWSLWIPGYQGNIVRPCQEMKEGRKEGKRLTGKWITHNHRKASKKKNAFFFFLSFSFMCMYILHCRHAISTETRREHLIPGTDGFELSCVMGMEPRSLKKKAASAVNYWAICLAPNLILST